MGVRILEGRESGEAVFYCSTSGWAFGPLMEDSEQAERFLKYLVVDPRQLKECVLSKRWSDFQIFDNEHCHDCGEPITFVCKHGRCKGCGCNDCEQSDAAAERLLDREVP